ncbi:MAG: RnfABCDGE type electron transport complex subunit B [Gammaproteobacteria bacterium]|nr:RnfABCDGE type electron transport complex subunit B [Gammaproteobacteria bacterium]MCP5417508.1 RnfABCDGE type electron transport complex subunit B [Chromatiaceae bacterium]
MSDLLIAPAIMAGLGLFFSVILAVAYRFLKVQEDPRIEETELLLPGSNCGACGQPGCHAFAEQLVLGSVKPSQCTVANQNVVDAVAELLDVDPGQQEKRVARLRCAGGRAEAFQIAEYHGFANCRAAAIVSGGGKGCSWGCLGLGDCAISCGFDAIRMNSNGLPAVDIDRCTACGDCVEACPRNLFVLTPVAQKLFVQCNTPLRGDAATALCKVACDACGRCSADAAPGLVQMVENLPLVDYSAGGPASPEATFRCPTGAIQWLEGVQFGNQDFSNPQSKNQRESRYA